MTLPDDRQKREALAARARQQPRTPGGTFGPIHGGFTLADRIQTENLDRRRREVQDYLATRDRLARDARGATEEGGDWPPPGLSEAQIILIQQAAFKAAVTAELRRYALHHRMVKGGGEVLPLLGCYTTWSDSLERTLVRLGLERRQRIKTPQDWRPAGA